MRGSCNKLTSNFSFRKLSSTLVLLKGYLAASRRDVLLCSVGEGWEEVLELEGWCEESLELLGGVDETTPSLTVSSRVN